jgi:hypothetical protein
VSAHIYGKPGVATGNPKRSPQAVPDSRFPIPPLGSRLLTVGTEPDQACRLGVLAFGDSITNGGGELQWGVALQSWALWVARSLGLPFTGYAVDGARAAPDGRSPSSL